MLRYGIPYYAMLWYSIYLFIYLVSIMKQLICLVILLFHVFSYVFVFLCHDLLSLCHDILIRVCYSILFCIILILSIFLWYVYYFLLSLHPYIRMSYYVATLSWNPLCNRMYHYLYNSPSLTCSLSIPICFFHSII